MFINSISGVIFIFQQSLADAETVVNKMYG